MRLLFWRNKEVVVPVATTTKTLKNHTAKPVRTVRPTTVPARNQPVTIELKRPVDANSKELAPLKAWCDINLNPLAWSRIVIRMLPVFRDFDRNLSDMQKPGPRTTVENDLYMLILATIQEIYGVEPQMILKKKTSVLND